IACPSASQLRPSGSQSPGGIMSSPSWWDELLWSPPPFPSIEFSSTGICVQLLAPLAWQIMTLSSSLFVAKANIGELNPEARAIIKNAADKLVRVSFFNIFYFNYLIIRLKTIKNLDIL